MGDDFRTILIVADELETAEMLEEMMRLCGYKVIRSHGGAASMKILLQTQPDILLLDLTMPDVSGLEVMRFIRREPKLLPLPVIVITSRGLPVEVKEGLEAGANVYLRKPVSFQDLRTAVEHIYEEGQ